MKVVLTLLKDSQISELMKDPTSYKKYEKHLLKMKRPKLRRAPTKAKPVSRSLSLGNYFEPIVIDDDDDNSEPPVEVTLAPIFLKQSATSPKKPLKRVRAGPLSKKNPKPAVVVVDLCSSDEEDQSLVTSPSTDENKDPLNMSGVSCCSPKKCSKTYDGPTDSPNTWLSNGDNNNDTANNILCSSARFKPIQ